MSLVRQVIFKCDHSKQKRPFAGPYSAHAKLVTSLHSNISDSEYRAEKVEHLLMLPSCATSMRKSWRAVLKLLSFQKTQKSNSF